MARKVERLLSFGCALFQGLVAFWILFTLVVGAAMLAKLI